MEKAQIQTALESAIAKHANADFPGAWKVEAGDGYVMLVWSCNEDKAPEMWGDEPWSEWGGDAMVKYAGIGEPDDSGCDGYQDKYGDQVVSQWVQWNITA